MEESQATQLFNKNSLLLIQGSIIAKFGDVLYSMAIGYYVYQLTASETLMGVFTSLSMFVTMFLSPISGVIIDRSNRKLIICSMDFLRSSLMLVIGLLCLKASLTLELLLLITLPIALAAVLHQPAIATILVDIVPKSEYVRANSINSSLNNIVDLVCKGLSGILLVNFGVASLILFNAFCFFFSGVTKVFIDIPPTPKQGSKVNLSTIIRDLQQGFLTLLKTKALNRFFICAILINLFSAGSFSLFLLIATAQGFDFEHYGYLLSLISLGSMLGAVVTSLIKFKNKSRPGVMITCFLLGEVLILLALLTNSFYVAACCYLLGHFSNAIGNVLLNATMLLLMPADKRATLLGFIQASSVGGFALSTLAYGFLAEQSAIIPVAVGGTLGSMFVFIVLFIDRTLRQAVAESGTVPES